MSDTGPTSLHLPVMPPLEPMLAKAGKLPDDDGFCFDPKWDGFRTLIFKDGDAVYLQSRDKKPLARYFPELLGPLRDQLPERCVLDSEIVVATADDRGRTRLDFDALQLRIHPAKSRVTMLSETTPASVVFFDLLAEGDEDLTAAPTHARRARLESFAAKVTPPLFLTPATTDRAVAADWFERFEGAGLDGVIAKPADSPYLPKKRGWIKVKHRRTAECVVPGFRWHKNGPGELVGSLLLGLYDDDGKLHHVGVTSSFTMKKRKELAEELEPLRTNALDDHPWGDWARAQAETAGQRKPGMGSRWTGGKDLSWEPLRLERVVEVAYDQLQGDRFRHGTTFLRWRTDKPLAACRYDQLETTPAFELAKIFTTT